MEIRLDEPVMRSRSLVYVGHIRCDNEAAPRSLQEAL